MRDDKLRTRINHLLDRHHTPCVTLPESWSMLHVMLGGPDVVEGGLAFENRKGGYRTLGNYMYLVTGDRSDLARFVDDRDGRHLVAIHETELLNSRSEAMQSGETNRHVWLVVAEHVVRIGAYPGVRPFDQETIAASVVATVQDQYPDGLPQVYAHTTGETDRSRSRMIVVARSTYPGHEYQLSIFSRGAGPTYHTNIDTEKQWVAAWKRIIREDARLMARDKASALITEWCLRANAPRV